MDQKDLSDWITGLFCNQKRCFAFFSFELDVLKTSEPWALNFIWFHLLCFSWPFSKLKKSKYSFWLQKGAKSKFNKIFWFPNSKFELFLFGIVLYNQFIKPNVASLKLMLLIPKVVKIETKQFLCSNWICFFAILEFTFAMHGSS